MNCIDKWLLFNMGFIKQDARIDRIRSLKALIKAILWYYYFLCNLSLYPQCPVLNGSMNRLDCDLTKHHCFHLNQTKHTDIKKKVVQNNGICVSIYTITMRK